MIVKIIIMITIILVTVIPSPWWRQQMPRRESGAVCQMDRGEGKSHPTNIPSKSQNWKDKTTILSQSFMKQKSDKSNWSGVFSWNALNLGKIFLKKLQNEYFSHTPPYEVVNVESISFRIKLLTSLHLWLQPDQMSWNSKHELKLSRCGGVGGWSNHIWY